MKLIDKDATKADIEKFNRPLCDGYHMKDYVLNQIINDIDDQPTVETIPVEWITKKRFKLGRQINKECFSPHKWEDEHFIFMVDKQIAYTQIIEEWRKENG